MVAGAVGEKFFVYNYKEDQLPEIFAKHLKWVYSHLKIYGKKLFKTFYSFFYKVKNTDLSFCLNEHVKLFNVFKKNWSFSFWQNISLLVQFRMFRYEQFPLLKNRWAKHDLVIFNSVMNMFCKGYNNLLFNFNCFKWMQWIQLYNKKFAFHRSIRM